MHKNWLIILFSLFVLVANARQTTVTTASSINNGSWIAGDTIVMKNGTWTNQVIALKATGTVLQPIVLQAETPGSVILTGTSKISFSGSYVTVAGLYFKDGTLSGSDIVSFRTSSSELAENCRLTNCTIANYNPAVNTVDSKWVSLYGKNNRVDHCSFENKNNSGTLLVVWLVSGVTVNHMIDSNFFGYRNSNLDSTGAELNGQEIIRVGDSSTSMTTAAVTVQNNFFEHCNGEIEIISNKSCGNLYTNNVFFECHGMLTLRHGNNCTVNGNYFFGNGVTESGGVRIIGENHKVYNNYFEKLKGTDYRAALCVVRGKENSALNEYYQVKNAVVAFNTMVDCTEAFNINYNSSTTCTLPPIGTTIAHNHVYNSGTSNYNVIIDQTNVAALGLTWKNNLMNQGKYTDFSYSASQVITGKDAKMTLAGTNIYMYEPASNSALLSYITTEYADVAQDIRGRNRGTTAKVPGASQISGTISKTMPTKTTVGSTILYNTTTKINEIAEVPNLKIAVSDKRISIETHINDKIAIYNLSGRCLIHKEINNEIYTSPLLTTGIYIVNIVTKVGNSISQKVRIL